MASTIVVSWSEINSYRHCPHKHALEYRERWRSPTQSPALSRGTFWHLVLETHYKLLLDARKTKTSVNAKWMFNAIRPLLHTLGQPQTEDQEIVEWMYIGYLEMFGLDTDWRVLAVEHAPEVWLPTEKGGRSRFKLKLKIDLIVKQRDGLLVIVDHKSCTDLPSKKMLELEDQFGLYTWAMRQLGHPVFMAIHNAARTKKYKPTPTGKTKPQPLPERFLRSPLYRTDAELDEIARDAYRTMKAAYSVPIESAPRHPDSDLCRWRCGFTDSCLFGRKGGNEIRFMKDKGYIIDRTRH